MRERGVKPLIGAEVTLAHGSHLMLLAETQAGYANLSQLITAGQLAGAKAAPVLTIEDVARHAGGMLCLTGCRQDAVAQAILSDDNQRAMQAAPGYPSRSSPHPAAALRPPQRDVEIP